MISFDIVIATHNRSALLLRALESLQQMRCPAEVSFRVIVVANACVDQTEQTVAAFRAQVTFPVLYLAEPTPGKSYALNRAVARCDAEWILFIDDDERICDDWMERFLEEQASRQFDFAGGRYIAEFEITPPSWLPPRHSSTVISRHDPEMPAQRLTTHAALMWGGNAVMRRAALERVGSFAIELGRKHGLNALGCEDVDMQLRLVDAGFVGWYLPALQIMHWTPKERLTKSYFREKSYWAGHNGRRFYESRRTAPEPSVQWFGIARWRWREVMRAAFGMIGAVIRFDEPRRFDCELDLRDFIGHLMAAIEDRAAARVPVLVA